MSCDNPVSVTLSTTFFWVAVSLAVAGGSARGAEVRVEIVGEAEAVWLHHRDTCGADDIPDAPARAFRDAAGTVHLIASNQVNRAMIGPSLDEARPDCRVLYRGGHRDQPDRFDDRAWLTAFHTDDGTTVHALVHNEYQGHRRPDLCPSRKYMSCWYNSVTGAVSHDRGYSFTRAEPPRHLVAAIPYRFDGQRGQHVGYFNPSNIVTRDGYQYTLVFATRVGAQQPGPCLIRTDSPDDPGSWRAWDGSGFSVAFANPYRPEVDDGATHVCTPVGRGALNAPVSSVVLHEPSGLYVATMAQSGGVFVSTSPDLIAWSKPRLLWAAVIAGRQSCGDGMVVNYPSLLDPSSRSRDFATTDGAAYLYFTRFHLEKCGLGMDRDLMRLPVRIDMAP